MVLEVPLGFARLVRGATAAAPGPYLIRLARHVKWHVHDHVPLIKLIMNIHD
jgi:hypothetical protein